MLLTNAEVYADNPEFQRDMLATVRASVGKITRLLTRLQAERQERDHALITPAERLRDLIGASREASHRDIGFRDDAGGAGVAIDPDAFDAVVTHLLNNAIDASNADTAIEVDLRLEPKRRRRYHRSWDRHDAGIHPRRFVSPPAHDQG